MRFKIVPAVAVIIASLPLAGCDLIELATSDRPNGRQRTAIGDIFAHVGTVGSVIGDPATASEGDLMDVFDPSPYVRLLTPDAASTAAIILPVVLPAGPPPDCLIVGDNSVTADQCQVLDCLVTGSGSKSGDSYTFDFTLDGPSCGTARVNGSFTLAGDSGTGNVDITTTSSSSNVDITLELQSLHFCPNGLPDGGKLIVTGSGTFDGLAFDDTVKVKFTGQDCGVAILE